jgi:dihydroorotase
VRPQEEEQVRTLIVRGGTLVTSSGVGRGDVLIQGEAFAAVSSHLEPPAGAEVLDATGLLVLPGLIDPHVHLRVPGADHKEDFFTGTSAALAGGFTTVVAMPNTSPALTTRRELSEASALAQGRVVCDVGFYIGATPNNTEEAARASQAVGLKMYMGSSTGDLLVADLAAQLAHFETYPGVIAVHAEDEEAVRYFEKQGKHRPPVCAALAVARALALAAHSGRRLHVCHVSTLSELELIRAAKARGVPVTCEVTPHHLLLSAEDAERLGPFGKMNPPLREQKHLQELWAHLDLFDCIATDHAPHTLQEKRSANPPAGVPGLETALPLLLTTLAERGLELTEIPRLMAEGPAAAFRLARKGRIDAGYDADLTLVDPLEEWVAGQTPLHTKCGWTPFEGRRVRGRVKKVLLRGQEAYTDGEIVVTPGTGRVIGPEAA